jgi:type I restriction enzyme S subunit
MFGGDDTNAEFGTLNESVEEMFIGPFGSSLKNDCFVEESQGYCMVYEQKHAINKSYRLNNRFVDEKKFRELKRFITVPGDIIVSCRGTIGETFILPPDAPPGIMHPSIMKIRLVPDAYNVIFFNNLLTRFFSKYTESKGSGVKMAITATSLGKLQFIRPPLRLQDQFASFVQQVDKSKFALKLSLSNPDLSRCSEIQWRTPLDGV